MPPRQAFFDLLFREAYGMSIQAYLTEIRIRRAKHLLLTTDLIAAQIGLQPGFKNAYHFYAVFEKTTGMPPIYYRCQHRTQ